MFAKSLTAGIVGSALLATAAFAQSPSTDSSTAPSAAPATTTSSTTATNSSYTGDWRASKVVGLNVYNDNNESLGSINDLLTDKSGKIVAVVIGVGGFLGVGEHYVALPFEKVKFSTEPVKTNTASTGGTGGAMGTTTPSTTTTGTGTGGMTAAPAATPAASTPNPWYPDHAVIDATKDQLKSMPQFKYNNT